MSEGFEPAPLPEDGQPDDWPDLEWRAYLKIVQDGTTRAAAAAEVGRSRSWMSGRVSAWKARYGEDVVPAPDIAKNAQRARLSKGDAELLAEPGVTYTALRDRQARAYMETSNGGVELMDAIRAAWAADPKVLASFTSVDYLRIAQATCLLSARAAGIQQEIAEENGSTVDQGAFRRDVPGLGNLSPRNRSEWQQRALASAESVLDAVEKRNALETTAAEVA